MLPTYCMSALDVCFNFQGRGYAVIYRPVSYRINDAQEKCHQGMSWMWKTGEIGKFGQQVRERTRRSPHSLQPERQGSFAAKNVGHVSCHILVPDIFHDEPLSGSSRTCSVLYTYFITYTIHTYLLILPSYIQQIVWGLTLISKLIETLWQDFDWSLALDACWYFYSNQINGFLAVLVTFFFYHAVSQRLTSLEPTANQSNIKKFH